MSFRKAERRFTPKSMLHGRRRTHFYIHTYTITWNNSSSFLLHIFQLTHSCTNPPTPKHFPSILNTVNQSLVDVH